MADCEGWAGWLLGHKYEPRYTTTERGREAKLDVMSPLPADALRALTILSESRYECDVCVRCGGIVYRRTPARGGDDPRGGEG